MRNFLIILSFLSSFPCLSQTENKMTNNNSEISRVTKAKSIQPIGNDFVEEKDSVLIPSFEIKLILSDTAEKRLTIQKESVIVKAYYSGIPKDSTIEASYKWGKYSLFNRSIELTDSRTAKFENIKISKKTYESLTNKNIEVLINVFSGRRSSDKNILNCDILEDRLSNLKNKSVSLTGRLIGE